MGVPQIFQALDSPLSSCILISDGEAALPALQNFDLQDKVKLEVSQCTQEPRNAANVLMQGLAHV